VDPLVLPHQVAPLKALRTERTLVGTFAGVDDPAEERDSSEARKL
jgi:hypothetical protein